MPLVDPARRHRDSSLPPLVVRTLGCVVAAACLALPAARAAGPAETISSPAVPAAAPADADDVWVVSTRRLPDVCGVPDHVTFDVERLGGEAPCRRWEQADLAALLDEPHRPLVIFIHGNRYDSSEAKTQGLTLARRAAAACPAAGPIRTVIFSWPSSQQGMLLKDSRAKYERSLSEGHYLAWLLGRVAPERPVAIVAFSYGALIALEALDHLAARPAVAADPDPRAGRRSRTHLVLVESAVRRDALAPRGKYRQVLGSVDRLTLFNNSRDLALKFFRCIDPGLRIDALGRGGMPATWVPAGTEFAQFDAAPVVGKSHRFLDFLESPALTRRLAAAALDGLPAD